MFLLYEGEGLKMEDRPGIKDIQIYLPDGVLDNKELIEKFGFEAEFLEQKIGITSRRIAKDKTVSDMAVHAAERLFKENADLSPGDVELLVVCTQNPDFKIPHTAAIVQDRLGLPLISTFDINLACSGYIYSLAVIISLMETQGIGNAVLVTSDAYSKVIDKTDRDTMAIFGDAATATWIAPGGLCHPMKYSLGTNGKDYDKLIVRNTASGTESSLPDNREVLFMNGREIFNFMMKCIPEDTGKCLEKNDLTIDNIDYFIFHQANKYMLDCLRKRMRIPENKMVYDLENTGNTVSSSIPIALKHLMEKEDLSGSRIFISGFGAGLSWASTILHF